jgi:1-acyl-sn-glycerol-3-phosphate acyltransferase
MTPKPSLTIYRIIQGIIKRALAIFFHKIELRHGENIPEHGPVVFVSNHPNSTMDALVLSSVIKRVMHYIGHSGLFYHKIKGWFLRSCGVIPVYRRTKEQADNIERNIEAFQACFETLEKGEAISIFPEGTSVMLRQVQKIKTGTARIVLEAERRNNYKLGVKIIPIGLHFFSRSHFRSNVLVNVGRAIDLQSYFTLNEKDSSEAVKQLTAQIQQNLEHLTVNIRHTELDQLVRDVESIYRDELMKETPNIKKSSKATIAEFVITQKIADCIEFYYEREPQKVHNMKEKINIYRRKLKRLHLKDAMLKEKTTLPQLLKVEIATLTKAILGLPLAVYGIINNYLPYLITEHIAKKFIQERTKILTALFLGGGFTFLVFYSIQVSLVWYFGGLLWAVIYFINLPVLGFFALSYTRKIREERERISFSFFLFTKRHLIGKMRYARKKLISDLNTIKEEYLDLTNAKADVNN